ncbi:MAG: DUF5665 domain-containing protein [bacterium]|nr:DUF5665 domain-containing protein [bacterium]
MSSAKEPVEKVYRSRKRLFIDNFIGGIAWGVGSVLGVTVIIAIVAYLLTQAQDLPYIGSWIGDLLYQIELYR